MSYNRRNFIKAAAGVAAGALATPYVVTSSKAQSVGGNGGKPLKIIQFVSDGTSNSMVAISDVFSRMVRGRGLCWLAMSRDDDAHSGMMDMASLSSCVTDSSAASSSWGSGCRINNGAVNCLTDGTLLKPLYELLREPHWKRGLVTTTEITHATPAGFGSAAKGRGDVVDIANYYRTLEIEVLLGGGQNIYKKEMLEEHDRFGYQIVKTSDELKKIDESKKVLGLFAGGHLPMTIDWLHHKSLQASVPTLAEMTTKALAMLSTHDNFILQVEGGRVDHACHGSDAPGAIYDHLAFDDAVQVALDYQKTHPETLIVVTADHGCGGPSLNGMGGGYNDTPKLLAQVQNAKGSFERLVSALRKCDSAPKVQEYIENNYGLKLSSTQANWLLLANEGRHSEIYGPISSYSGQLGQTLGNHFAISWGSGNHDGDYVKLVAKGPGADRFKGLIRNTEVFDHYMDFAGIKFRNKQWTGQAARMAPVSMDGHWFNTMMA